MSGVSDFLKTVAPTVASALLGPFGGVAVAGLGKLFGVDNATTESITKLIQQGSVTPEQMAELQKMEAEYKEHEAERGFKYKELEYKDVDSARNRDVELAKAGRGNYRADIMAYGALIAFGLSGYALIKMEIPQANRELIVYLLGALTVIVKDLYGFEFGSSRGSHAKDDTITRLTSTDR